MFSTWDPIRILDLAETMIRLSGLTIKNDEHPNGDVEVNFIGLRPGEKLYEELLIGENVESTRHPKISCAMEEALSAKKLQEVMDLLRDVVNSPNPQKIKEFLALAVKGYDPSTEDVDWLKKNSSALALGICFPAPRTKQRLFVFMICSRHHAFKDIFAFVASGDSYWIRLD